MMKKRRKTTLRSSRIGIMFVMAAAIVSLAAHEDIDKLLHDFSSENALSKRTIDENKGHLILFTRDDLERMRARTLKDVFKATPVIYYHENRYALPDPLAGPSYSPYMSSYIRIYIDGVEVTAGWLGSGLMLYGDMNIDFVDHIEFYYATPSFDISVEPAYLSVFLYSKQPEHDPGGRVALRYGSRGYNEESVGYSGKRHDTSYMVSLVRTDAKRSKVDNGTSKPLSRDFTRWQWTSYVKDDDEALHLYVISKKSDGLAGASLDATPITSHMDYLTLHVDYVKTFEEGWKLQLAYDRLHTEGTDEDDYPTLLTPARLSSDMTYKTVYETRLSTYSGELTYRHRYNAHHLAMGLKGRIKQFDCVSTEATGSIPLNFDRESVYALFLQDQYVLRRRHLLSFGVEGMYIDRNGGTSSPQNESLLQLRAGYLYNGERWKYKTYLYRMMFVPDPYLYYFSNAGLSPNAFETPQKTVGFTQEIAYETEKMRADVMLFYAEDEDSLLENKQEEKIRYFFSILRWEYRFDYTDKLQAQLYMAHYRHLFNLEDLKDWSAYVSYSGNRERFGYYAGLIWHRNSIDYTNYLDVDVSLSWQYKEDLSFTLKGTNILNRAKETGIVRIDPQNGALLEPLSVSPYDRRITFEMEYLF